MKGQIEELEKQYPDFLPDAIAKEAILQIGKRLYDKSFVAANDGNISCLVAHDQLWISPAGVSKGFMSESMLIKVDRECRVLEGTWLPSSEMMLHLQVYQEDPEVRAVIHAHSPVATAFACAGLPLDQPILAEAMLILGSIPVAAYAQPGTPALAESIRPYIRGYSGVLLENHGVLTWGASLTEAMYRIERIEYYANLMMLTGYFPQTQAKPHYPKAVDK